MDKPIKILHLEDVPTDAELVEYELQKGNIKFEKRVVDNKDDFVRMLSDFNPDIILSDHSLPFPRISIKDVDHQLVFSIMILWLESHQENA